MGSCVRGQSVLQVVTTNMVTVISQESASVKLDITERIVTNVISCWVVAEMAIVRRLLNASVKPDGLDYSALSRCAEKVVT